MRELSWRRQQRTERASPAVNQQVVDEHLACVVAGKRHREVGDVSAAGSSSRTSAVW
ncbi:MAG: hypothetical protein ABI488_13210 [Polyangiaceae bacterium]